MNNYAKIIDGKLRSYQPTVETSADGRTKVITSKSEEELQTEGYLKVYTFQTGRPQPGYKPIETFVQKDDIILRDVKWVKI